VKEQQRNEIKVGLTVVVGIAILFLGFSTFKDWSVGADEYVIVMRFPSSAGLSIGDQVSVNGVRAGKIESVELLDGGVEVHARMPRSVEIKRNALPVIQMLELMGGKKVEIRQGNEGPALADGEVLHGRVDPDIAGALGMLGGMEGSVENLTAQADTLLRGMNGIVGDEAFVASLKSTVANLHTVSEDLRSYLRRNNRNIDALTENFVSLTGRVDTMLAELQPALGGSLKKSDRLLGNADSLVTEVRTVIDEIQGSRGMLNTILHDTTFVHRMDMMLDKLDTLTRVILDGELKVNVDIF
jgi:phospholipid/cholesterol/gamma-HCH transport system substrate-binding protein